MLRVQGLTKRFGGFTAVDAISFELRQGEILGLIGPNGSGKSTTFNVIAGTVPALGRLDRLHGPRDRRPAAEPDLQLGLARTFQIPRPFRKLSILENATLAAFYGAPAR